MKEQTTILVVDDDEAVLSGVSDILRVSGYRLLMSPNGAKALQVLQHHTPDLILSDIMMREMDGYQFYEAVRSNPAWTAIPFIFLSARGEQQDIRQGYQLGADHYLTKPFEPEDLLLAVEARLKRTAEIQAATRAEIEGVKNQLLAIVGHEMHAPLSWVYGYTSMLQEGHTAMADEVVDKMLGDVRGRVERLIGLVEDLMLLVCIDGGVTGREIARRREPVVVLAKADKAILTLRPKAEAKNIAFTTTVDRNLLVNGVPEYIETILERLIDNAITFGLPDGRVWVKAGSDGEYTVVTIQDNGVGIPPEQQATLFTHFRQIDPEAMDQEGGGIGLAIVEGLVRLHGGRIEVASQLNEGSTFSVWLPTKRPV